MSVAYNSNVIDYSAGSVSEACAAVYTALEACGWTLYDTVSATSKVYTSQGEEGKYAPIYIHVYVSTTLKFDLYLYWDIDTNTGSIKSYGTYGVVTITSTTNNCVHYYGNKNYVALYFPGVSTYHPVMFGFPDHVTINASTTTLTAPVTAGSSVTLTVGSTKIFRAGGYYQIIGSNGEGRDLLLVTCVINDTTLKVYSLPRNYASGSYFGQCPCPAFNSWGSTSMLYYCYLLNYYSYAGTGAPGNNFLALSPAGGMVTSIDPGQRHNLNLLIKPCFVTDTAKPLWWFENSCASPKATKEYAYSVLTVMSDWETGIAETGSANTLQDTDKSWGVDEWAGKYVVIESGTGLYQARKILSNTSDTLTVVRNWLVNPSSNSVYVICDEVWRDFSKIAFKELQ